MYTFVRVKFEDGLFISLKSKAMSKKSDTFTWGMARSFFEKQAFEKSHNFFARFLVFSTGEC
jgi:hypothetical protein